MSVNPPDIFLSYNREDQATAQRFAEAFEAQGFSVWWDVTLRSGEAYDQVTEAALKSAKAVVVLWSKMSVVSRWVRAEATVADRNRTLVPVRIEECDLPIMFELTQTADLSHWRGEAADPAWSGFLADVRRMVEARVEPVRPATAPGSGRPARGKKPSLAVLPFINRSELREDEVFANGMVEDLAAALSLSPHMKVVTSSATQIYRKAARDLRQIGRDLGVRYLLEGNVRRVGDNLRVTAQLVEAETDNIRWTQKFDRPLAELADLQEELVTEVAAHLGVQVQRAEIEHALRKPGDITVLEALLRSDSHMFRSTRAGLEAAVAEARRAVEIDPDYGPTYAVLAAAQGLLFRLSGGNDPQLAREVEDNIRRARGFDPGTPLALCRLAAAYHCVGKPHEALRFAERAVALNPNSDMIRQELASIYLLLDRPEDALQELAAADRLAPNGPGVASNMFNRSLAHLLAGRLEPALEAAMGAVRLLPATDLLIQSSLCLALSNRRDEARAALGRLRDADPAVSLAYVEWWIRDKYRASGAVDDFVDAARELWHLASSEEKAR